MGNRVTLSHAEKRVRQVILRVIEKRRFGRQVSASRDGLGNVVASLGLRTLALLLQPSQLAHITELPDPGLAEGFVLHGREG